MADIYGNLIGRLDRWIAHFGEPSGNGRSNPDNDMPFLLRDTKAAIEAMQTEIARLSTFEANATKSINELDKALGRALFTADRRLADEQAAIAATFDSLAAVADKTGAPQAATTFRAAGQIVRARRAGGGNG